MRVPAPGTEQVLSRRGEGGGCAAPPGGPGPAPGFPGCLAAHRSAWFQQDRRERDEWVPSTANKGTGCGGALPSSQPCPHCVRAQVVTITGTWRTPGLGRVCFMSHAEASDSTSLRGALGLGTCRPRGTPSVKAQQPRGRAEACPGAGLLCRRGAAGTERRPGLALPVLAFGAGTCHPAVGVGASPRGF